MIGHAVRHADIWNTMSFATTFEAMIAETRQRVETVNARCAGIGRDPSSLRRSFFMTSASDTSPLYESVDTFTGLARQLIDLGFSDLALSYPRREDHVRTFEQIARSVLPELRAAHAA